MVAVGTRDPHLARNDTRTIPSPERVFGPRWPVARTIMNPGRIARKAAQSLRTNGPGTTLFYALRRGVFGTFDASPLHRGQPIYDREWDLLVVLDACRPDLLREVSEEYGFLPDRVRTAYSVGSSSLRWHDRNFTQRHREEMRNTALVTSNPWTDETLTADAFERLDEVWRYAWDDSLGTVRPGSITDRTIAAGREDTPDRLIAHYMQPHFPSIPDPLDSELDLENWGERWDGNVWQQLETGELSRERVWESYRSNLRLVLDDVEVLLSNVDAERVVVTADHGNAFGEWRVYGHPHDVHLPVLRSVPWVVCSASDEGTRDPVVDDERTAGPGDDQVTERLADLGYLP